jgi:dihydroflavonol-4-reductase
MDTDQVVTPGTVVVTGASGFVGVHLVRRLLGDGWRVRTIDLHPTVGVDQKDVEHTVVDVRDGPTVRACVEGADLVYHLAAKITLASDDPEAWDINTVGPATVAGAARDAGVARLVHCSSVHAFDLVRSRPRLDEHSPRSTDPSRPVYDRSKAAGEAAVRRVIDDGLDATIVNPTGIFGPVDFGPSRINAIIDQAARGHLPVVVAGGFDWVDVRDVVEGLVSASERGRRGESYLLPGHQATAMHLGRLSAGLNGHLGPIVALSAGTARRLAPLGERVGRLLHSEAFTPASIGTLLDDPTVDGTKAATELGHDPRPLEDSVRDTVRWFEGIAQP